MPCKELDQKLTDYLFEELSELDRLRVEEHLASCEDCARELEVLKNAVSLVDQACCTGFAGTELTDDRRLRLRAMAARSVTGAGRVGFGSFWSRINIPAWTFSFSCLAVVCVVLLSSSGKRLSSPFQQAPGPMSSVALDDRVSRKVIKSRQEMTGTVAGAADIAGKAEKSLAQAKTKSRSGIRMRRLKGRYSEVPLAPSRSNPLPQKPALPCASPLRLKATEEVSLVGYSASGGKRDEMFEAGGTATGDESTKVLNFTNKSTVCDGLGAEKKLTAGVRALLSPATGTASSHTQVYDHVDPVVQLPRRIRSGAKSERPADDYVNKLDYQYEIPGDIDFRLLVESFTTPSAGRHCLIVISILSGRPLSAQPTSLCVDFSPTAVSRYRILGQDWLTTSGATTPDFVLPVSERTGERFLTLVLEIELSGYQSGSALADVQLLCRKDATGKELLQTKRLTAQSFRVKYDDAPPRARLAALAGRFYAILKNKPLDGDKEAEDLLPLARGLCDEFSGNESIRGLTRKIENTASQSSFRD